jgi:glycosyltransferase involved in cell wall biosynthesis
MIDIVLATYNGKNYVSEQLASILENSNQDLIGQIVVSDDNSRDNTLQLVKECKDHRINVHLNTIENSGVVNNFQNGLKLTTSEYVMFSDQDDIWTNDKILIAFNGIKELERKYGSATPLLFFTDLMVVDEKLNVINNSFFDLMKINPNNKRFENLLFQNVSPGCVMIFNRALINKALPFPKEAMMHDWWLILVASYFGQVSYSTKSTILYRQHSSNTIGAKKKGFRDIVSTFIGQKSSTFDLVLSQNAAFYSRYKDEGLINHQFFMESLLLNEVGFFKRIKFIFKHRPRQGNAARTLLLYLRIIL